MGILKSDRNSGDVSALYEFTQGIAVDARLASQEIAVQRAWARGLHKIAVLSEKELGLVEKNLGEAQSLIESNTFEWRVEDEDIHMNLERFATQSLGELGKKMHWGRSRNDLIATTLRLYARDSLKEVGTQTRALIAALVTLAEANTEILMPGLTHVQHGQPLRFSHFVLSHAQALVRDLRRLEQAQQEAVSEMPLGSAALAGTPLNISLGEIAQELGFATAAANSYDAVGNRDFLLQGLNAMSQLAIHLSRLSEDCIYWSSTSVGLLQLPKDWSTGSSIMPNKRNPDVPELIRAKSAHILGAANEGAALMKGVPTSYASDLHELKGVYMRAFDELRASLKVFPPFIVGLKVNKARANEILGRGHILATEIADALVEKGSSFRDAYKKIAGLVEKAEASGKQVHEVVAAELPELADRNFSFEKAVEMRRQSGGTSLEQVKKQITMLKSL